MEENRDVYKRQVRVPLFIDQGEMIRVDTRTGEYMERA